MRIRATKTRDEDGKGKRVRRRRWKRNLKKRVISRSYFACGIGKDGSEKGRLVGLILIRKQLS